jgi:hypothetical protein
VKIIVFWNMIPCVPVILEHINRVKSFFRVRNTFKATTIGSRVALQAGAPCHILEDNSIHRHRYKNLKSCLTEFEFA